MLTEEYYNSKIESIQNNFEKSKKLTTSEDYAYLNYIK
jgi:hypothetical protein